jgi:guanylate kinase
MINTDQGRLIILSGPSGVGKTPLKNAFAHFYQDTYTQMLPLVLFTSRAIRPGESEGSDFFFRSLKEVKKLNQDSRYIVFKVHNDLQALDKIILDELLKHNDVFFEGNTTVGRLFQTHPDLADIKKVTIFLSPISGQEVMKLKLRGKKFFRETVQKIVRQKLLRRIKQYGSNLDSHEIKNIQQRATDAYLELKEAHHFDYIIPNHDGEDSDNWERSLLPSGDAGRALDAFAAILTNKSHPNIENWEENLVP